MFSHFPEKLKAADEKRNDELKVKLEEALTQKQEADAQNEQLKRKMSELEHILQSGGSPRVSSDDFYYLFGLYLTYVLFFIIFSVRRASRLLPSL